MKRGIYSELFLAWVDARAVRPYKLTAFSTRNDKAFMGM